MARLPSWTPILFACLAATTSAVLADGDERWVFEFGVGDAYNFDGPLNIQQRGEPTLDFTADWATGGTGTFHMHLRAGRWVGHEATELEFLHHKIILQNRPPEVANFQISHGLNHYMINHAWEEGGLVYRYGGGVIIAHPENTIRGRQLNEETGIFDLGQHPSGLCVQGAVEKRFPITDDLFLSVEAKATAAWVDVKVVGGDAELWNFALHGLGGIGYEWD